MEERKNILDSIEEYEGISSKISSYFKSKYIPQIFKEKHPLFATGGKNSIINIFTNSLQHMGYFLGHSNGIECLLFLSTTQIASGSYDNTIKIWDLKTKSIIYTLSLHKMIVSALCLPRGGILISGSWDKTLIIWNLGEYILPTQPRMLIGHKSHIRGIIQITDEQIISGEEDGDLRIWEIYLGTCLLHIPTDRPNGDFLYQIKYFRETNSVACCLHNRMTLWGDVNNWLLPINILHLGHGCSVEIISPEVIVRGGNKGELGIIHLGIVQEAIMLHSGIIKDICRLARDIVATVSVDATIKVIHIYSRKCYLCFVNDRYPVHAIAKLY